MLQTKKTILLFIDWYLPGYKAGGPIQSCANLVSHLNEDYYFKIITRNTDYCETKPYQNIKSNEWNIINQNVQIYYFGNDQLSKKNIYNLIHQTNFDIIYLNGVFSYFFTIVPLLYLRKHKGHNAIVAARGMFASGALAIKRQKKQLFLSFSKLMGLFNNVVFHATNESEKKDIIKVMGSNYEIKIAGNLPKKIAIEGFAPKSKKSGSIQLINVARIAPEKNLKYALEILKDVKANVQFDYFGPIYDERYHNECKAVIEVLPKNIAVNYKGVIPNLEVNETLKNYDAMLMPTLGENFGHIILESLIAARPVIISDQTPWQNLEVDQSGWCIPLNEFSKYVQAIELLAQCNEEQFNIFSLAAYQKAKSFIENKDLITSNRALFDF
jgi:glycosyltransferase involved in cell wall biosynthesis